LGIALDALQHLQPVRLGQLDVEEHHPGVRRGSRPVSPPTVKEVRRLPTIVDDEYLGTRPVLVQSGEGELDVVGVVFDQLDHTRIIQSPSP
jgi:hypothetical protein